MKRKSAQRQNLGKKTVVQKKKTKNDAQQQNTVFQSKVLDTEYR